MWPVDLALEPDKWCNVLSEFSNVEGMTDEVFFDD